MVSSYYHSLFENDRSNRFLVEKTRKDLGIVDPDNIKDHLPQFIEYKFQGGGHPSFTWCEFVNDWIDKDVPYIKYEDLLVNAEGVLSVVVSRDLGMQPDMERISKCREILFSTAVKEEAGRRE